MIKKLDLSSYTPGNRTPQQTNRSLSPSSKGSDKGQSTFNKQDFLFLNTDDSQLTFSPRINNKNQSSTVLFYQNKLRIKVNKCTFDDLLSWKGNYNKIEIDQSIIQYLFPSLQGKQGDTDSEEFINSPELAKKIILAYELILDYYGLKLENQMNGEIVPNNNYRERQEQTLQKTLSKNVHAYRVKRVLNFLSKTGFLVYCHQFIKFMQTQIKGDDLLLKKAQIGQTDRLDFKNVPVPPLFHLNDIFESDWKKFDELDLKNEMQQKMLKNQSVFFKSSKYTKSKLLTEFDNQNTYTIQKNKTSA
ncbi:opioid growth factor receptor (macronuclear) [Tetrahymena thermophila SB210]|uniref:Opioid growth factor receptor n=1 Tax=Tetrahymena thermophila (strain SB210) TaxID=312017 RepID=I7M3F7_TETTS|nr:opioid growth factor receptor [Tetrahymena thermophila SB210]EAS03058.3 opioid growth factor receptor [Tetrahymena thermophila SB210]|eukprot:XP_001023303.3 opioid growth factor receptor [Tetrahymena thermophila SB210]